MKWRYVDTGAHQAAWNMEFDGRLAQETLRGVCSPVFRVYGWNPNAVSVGRNQPMSDFDLPALAAAGIDIVRRPTGGKAILHANELTYSVVMRCDDTNLKAVFRTINLGLLKGLRRLGIAAGLTASGSDFRDCYRDPASVACFSSFARSEIQANGKKLIGSAQRRYGNVVLQHGSFLLDDSHLRISDYLGAHFTGNRDLIRMLLEESTIDARSILGRDVSYDEAAAAFKGGCAEEWNAEFAEDEVFLPQAELTPI